MRSSQNGWHSVRTAVDNRTKNEQKFRQRLAKMAADAAAKVKTDSKAGTKPKKKGDDEDLAGGDDDTILRRQPGRTRRDRTSKGDRSGSAGAS